VKALADLGVTDAEQLVALSAIPDARGKIAQTIGVRKAEFDSLLREAKKILPPPTLAEMEHPLPAMFGLGAMEPPAGEAEAAAAMPADIASAPPAGAAMNIIANMPPIRNQGSRGTCVSFTLTAVQDYYRRLHGVANPNWSEQHLYHEIKLIDGSPAACGTWQSKGAIVLANRGQCREVIWPYNPNPPCNNNGVMPPTARPDALNYRLNLTALSAKNVGVIRSALSTRRPVGISFPVFDSWYLSAAVRSSGRITMPLTGEPQHGGHAVCLVGFQDQPSAPGGGYFILRNSWGTTWGSLNPYGAGYGIIPYAYITSLNWEAYTLTTIVISDEAPEDMTEAPKDRTITIKLKGNVNLVFE
jgi:Papain family cysteine protease